MTRERLLIVYNADAGLLAGIKDSLHKLLKPETYPCSLCALTHGLVREDPVWARFLARIPYETRVYHRPDFRARYPHRDVPLPAVLIDREGEVSVLLGARELASLATVDDLISEISQRLN